MATKDALVSPHELKQSTEPIILDARGGPDAFERYKKSHIHGAVFVDLETELSTKAPNVKHGGRHPLPSPEKFSILLTELGITKESHVVVYDDKNGGNAAARLWWMLRAAGITNSQVLDGGLQTAESSGIVLSQEVSQRIPGEKFHFEKWSLPTTKMSEVSKAIVNPNALIIDVREAYRFNGESEPIDLIAGHIPNAVNVPYIDNLDVAGKFLDAESLKAKYQQVIGDRDPANVIVHCGSGVTACHTLLAMHHAGITGAKLYVGSWSEWSRTDNELICQ
jgi:thiosulfate/3-mercaptopyruvate sulfurtransferase